MSEKGGTCSSGTAIGATGGGEDDRHDLAASHRRARRGKVAGSGWVRMRAAPRLSTANPKPIRGTFRRTLPTTGKIVSLARSPHSRS